MKNPMNQDKSDNPEPRANPSPHWTERLRSAIPTRDALAAHPWLKPIAHHVLDPKLWRMHHEAVARGAAIGIFWGFTLPAGQIVVAVANSVWWRANIPVAVGMTLLTNPFTIGFWLWLAYKAGSLVLEAPAPLPFTQIEGTSGIAGYVSAIGAPAILGMGMFAVGGAALAYVLVKIIWRIQFWLKHKNRANRHKRTALTKNANPDKNHD